MMCRGTLQCVFHLRQQPARNDSCGVLGRADSLLHFGCVRHVHLTVVTGCPGDELVRTQCLLSYTKVKLAKQRQNHMLISPTFLLQAPLIVGSRVVKYT